MAQPQFGGQCLAQGRVGYLLIGESVRASVLEKETLPLILAHCVCQCVCVTILAPNVDDNNTSNVYNWVNMTNVKSFEKSIRLKKHHVYKASTESANTRQ